VKGCCGHVQLVEQGWIPLGQVHDHLDKGVHALFLQVITNARKRTFRCRIAARGIGG
jgi:hypothetical protein